MSAAARPVRPDRETSLFRILVHTEIDIAAPPARCWEVLTDFAAYPQWNPMVKQASGELLAGKRLSLHYHPQGQKQRHFRPLLLTVESGRELRWQGQPGARFLVESEHSYVFTELSDGTTHLDHDMVFWGLLIPPFKGLIERTIREPFNEQNRALKLRAEVHQVRV